MIPLLLLSHDAPGAASTHPPSCSERGQLLEMEPGLGCSLDFPPKTKPKSSFLLSAMPHAVCSHFSGTRQENNKAKIQEKDVKPD